MTIQNTSDMVILGRVTGVFGIKGFVKVFSDTEVRTGILNHAKWFLVRDGKSTQFELESGQAHGKGIIAKLKGIDDRDVAAKLIGSEIAINRAELPVLPEGEYYWQDLVGLSVVNTEGVELGAIASLFSTGANDVVVVEGDRERLIPFVQGDVITSIDLNAKTMTVDWDPEF